MTSVIPTFGGSATRAADLATVDLSGIEFAGFTAVAHFVSPVAVRSQILSENDKLGIEAWRSGNYTYKYTDPDPTDLFLASTALEQHVAISENASGRSLVVNGAGASGGATSVNGVGYTSLGIMRIGARYDGANPLNGHLRSVRIYKRKISDARMKHLTKL